MQQTAKIFATGRSQAVRLPLEFRFDVSEVFIPHDFVTADVVLSRKPTDFQGLLDAVAQNKDEDVLIERRRVKAQDARRALFERCKEWSSATCSIPRWSATSCRGAMRLCWHV